MGGEINISYFMCFSSAAHIVRGKITQNVQLQGKIDHGVLLAQHGNCVVNGATIFYEHTEEQMLLAMA